MPLESTRHRSVTLSSSSGNGLGSKVGLGSSGCGWLVRGQYEGYRGEEGVGPVSTTDTFAMAVLGMRGDNKGEGKGEGLNIGDERSSDDSGNANTHETDGDYEYNNDDQDGGLDGDGVDGLCGRWCGVPMVLVAGKGMHKKEASVRIEYRPNTSTTSTSTSTTITVNPTSSSSSSNVLDEVLDVMKEVNTEVARLQALIGKESPTTTIVAARDESVCVGLALVLQIQPQPGLYIERQLKSTTAATVVTEREVLLTLANLLSCPVHDPLGRALQLWPSPQSTTSGPSPVPVPTEAYTRILQALLTSPSRPSHRDDTSSPDSTHYPRSGTAHDRLFVSPEEVALQWSLFDQALAHNVTDPADITGDADDVNGKDRAKDVTNTLIRYTVGSDVESVLRGSGVGLDGLLLDTDADDNNATVGRSDAKVVPPDTEIGVGSSKRPGG